MTVDKVRTVGDLEALLVLLRVQGRITADTELSVPDLYGSITGDNEAQVRAYPAQHGFPSTLSIWRTFK